MANRKYNISSAVFFILMVIGSAVYSFVTGINLFKSNIPVLIFFISIAFVIIFMITNLYPGVILFSITGAIMLIYDGGLLIRDFISIREYFSDINDVLFSKATLVYLCNGVFLLGQGIAFILMAFSIGVNTARQQITGLSTASVVVSLISVIPYEYSSISRIIKVATLKSYDWNPEIYYFDDPSFTKIMVLLVVLAIIPLFCTMGIIKGSHTLKFKGRVHNNYRPYNELDLSSDQNRPGEAAGHSAAYTKSQDANNFSGNFYQPYSDDAAPGSGDEFYQTYGSSSAAENLARMDFSNTSSDNINVKDVNFTATNENYTENEFSVPDSGMGYNSNGAINNSFTGDIPSNPYNTEE